MMKVFTGSLFTMAVAISCMFIWMLPSPAMQSTSLSRNAACAPIAAGSPKPIVPSPPEVSHLRGLLSRKCWAANIWCCPTSVATIGSLSFVS